MFVHPGIVPIPGRTTRYETKGIFNNETEDVNV